MDNDFRVDMRKIAATLGRNEVAVMRFVSVGHRLLLDFRSSGLDGPMIHVVEPVRTAEERLRELARLRPRFPAPPKVAAIWWPRYVRSLEEAGIWAKVLERVADAGYPQAVREAQAAFAQLLALESRNQRAAIRGEGFRTLWSATAAAR